MDPYWILHFLAFLAFWVREHFNAYKWAQKRILFPHGAWPPNNTKRKKHMFLVRPHFSQRTFKSQQILIHTHTYIYIFHFETQRKTLALWHHHHRSHLWKLTPMKPEKKAQRHGKRTKNIYQTIILPILLNSGDFLDILKNLHLFTFAPNERIPNGRSVQLNGLKASMPYSRYVAHCSNLMWPPRRSSWWVTWAAVSLWTGHWNVWKFQAKGIKKMNKGCILFSSRPSQSARIPILVRSPQKTNAANAPEKWKKWWHWKTILFSLKWSQFQVTGSGKTDLWGIGPFEDVFPIERCVFFRAKRLHSALWVPGQMDIFMEELGAKGRQASLVVGGGWLRLGAVFFFR